MLTDELLHFIQTEKNTSMEFVEQAQTCGKDIYLYGAGNHLRFVVQFMKKYHIEVKAILDSNKQGVYEDIPILLFSDFLTTKPNADSWFVISAPSVAAEIAKTLSAYFPTENIFSIEMEVYLNYIPDVDEYRKYMIDHWKDFSALSDSLADDQSRETLEAVLRGRISGNKMYFQQCYTPDTYYPSNIIHLTNDEVMVELGGNNGETLLEFLRLCPDYKSVYCFEPDPVCLPALKSIAANSRGSGVIHIIPKGAWDCSTVLEFYSDGEGKGDAHIVREKENTACFKIETASVDEVVKEPITFLKMDIEGAELRALHGARQQIVENHPKLAVCVYHRTEDILDIWNYLRELVPEYQFYLRHHYVDRAVDTVLYATI